MKQDATTLKILKANQPTEIKNEFSKDKIYNFVGMVEYNEKFISSNDDN